MYLTVYSNMNVNILTILPHATMMCNFSEFPFSVLTPYYREDVLYSTDEINRENEDGISILFYLTKIYPGEYCFYMLSYHLCSSSTHMHPFYCLTLMHWRWMGQSPWAHKKWRSWRVFGVFNLSVGILQRADTLSNRS